MTTPLLGLGLVPLTAAAAAFTVSRGVQTAEPVRFAAEELGRYVALASGARVIVREDAALDGRATLTLDVSEGARGAAPRFPVSAHEEAYRIHSTPHGGRVFAANSPRAALYAVYDFLETELGYRWYFPYPEDGFTPAIAAAALAARLAESTVDRETQPFFSFREREFRDVSPMTASTDDRIVQQIDWWAKLRMNRFLINFRYAANPELWTRWQRRLIPELRRRGLLLGLGEHGSYPLFLPPERYAAAHPEWYCELDGKRIGAMHTPSGEEAQFCTTHPGAAAAYLENFAAFVRAHPEVDFYYPAPNDVGRWCECASCAQWSIADRYLRLNNQVAEMLARVKPGTRVMHLAYSNHRLPPEHTLPHAMIDVDVACWGRDFSYPLGDARTMPEDPDYLEVFRRWAEICRRQPAGSGTRLLYHWKIMRHYWLGLHLLPLQVIDADFDAIRTLGIDGFDLPLGYLGIWTKALNAYVAAHKTWNPDLPAAALTARFMTDYYGAWSEAAHRIYQDVAEAFRDRRYGRSLTLAWFPATSMVRDEPLEGLGDNARHAAERLQQALARVAPLLDTPPPFGERFRKLHVVVRHARDEQRVLVKLDAMMRAAHLAQRDDSPQARRAALEAWETVKAANDALADRYSLQEDAAGLYWGGASHRQIDDALARWRLRIETLNWQTIGGWETADFADSTAPIRKRFDVTEPLSGRLPAQVQVRFQYTSGGLGASLRAAALWAQTPDGSKSLLAEDRHGGFAGYVHRDAVYHLDVRAGHAAGARYLVEVELAAVAASGSVAERGSNGTIWIGLPPCTP